MMLQRYEILLALLKLLLHFFVIQKGDFLSQIILFCVRQDGQASIKVFEFFVVNLKIFIFNWKNFDCMQVKMHDNLHIIYNVH